MSNRGATSELEDQVSRLGSGWPTVRDGVAQRRSDADYADAIGQSRGWTPAEVLAWGHVHTWIANRRAYVTRFHLGRAPERDERRAQNAAVLEAAPWPLRLVLNMEQRCSPGGDGEAQWLESITLPGSPDVIIPPRPPIPLEVGTTEPSTTLMHLGQYGGVARWPYGSEDLWLIVLRDRSEPARLMDEANEREGLR